MYIFVFRSKKNFFYRRVTVVVLLLSDQFNLFIFILGKPGTCEKTGRFQCNNGKCIWKHLICDSNDDCGDKSDESKTDGAFCGMLLNFFVALTGIFCLTCYDQIIYIKTNVNSLRVALTKISKKFNFSDYILKMVFTYVL